MLEQGRKDVQLVSDARLNRIILERERQRQLDAKKKKKKKKGTATNATQAVNPLEDVEQVRIAYEPLVDPHAEHAPSRECDADSDGILQCCFRV